MYDSILTSQEQFVSDEASCNAGGIAGNCIMADIYSKVKRSQIMSRIRARGNLKTELALAKLLRQHRIIGWRRHPKLFGNPDFVFREHRLAIFVDGCFWHGCLKHASQPATNRAFWKKKLLRNKDRDRLVTRTLKTRGWHVLRIWQHELTGKSEVRCVSRIRQVLDCGSGGREKGLGVFVGGQIKGVGSHY